ncbi:MAG: acyltransferase family protein [Chitinophagales bacterium]|nr:acyltransferase family protein [Chitinophagales bacterium]
MNGIKPFVNAAKIFYEQYFRVDAYGLENIPKEGRCLIIGNHSGQLPIDAMLLGYALVTNEQAPRAPKGMFERFVPQVPFFGTLFSQWGGALGDPENCMKMLNNDEAVIIFPEGARGISKPYSRKYQLQNFGNGYIAMALKSKAPIIPVGIAGCEEILVNFGNIKFLEKALRFPSFPTLVPFMFPSKVIMHFGEPIYFEGDVGNEIQLQEKNDIVKAEVERLIQLGLDKGAGFFK